MSASPQLTIVMRSCLLRAARARLAQLQADFDAQGNPALLSEIGCVTESIRWLWLQPAVG